MHNKNTLNKFYTFSLSLLSAAFLFSNIMFFDDNKFFIILPILIYFISIIVATEIVSTFNHRALVVTQALYLVPFLVPISLNLEFGILGGILSFVIMALFNVFGIGEINKLKNDYSASDLWFTIGGGVLSGILVVKLMQNLGFDHEGKIKLLIFCYLLLTNLRSLYYPGNLPIRKNLKIPMLLGIVIIITSLTAVSFTNKYVYLIYSVVYAVIVTASLAYYRYNNFAFLILISSLIIASFFPFSSDLAGVINFTDIGLISSLTAFLIIRNPILKEFKTSFGNIQIKYTYKNDSIALYNGGTVHGRQSLDPSKRLEPNSYYCLNGPVGQLMDKLPDNEDYQNIAIIGLGIGTTAIYGKKGQNFDFYEINPLVEQIARDESYFTFMKYSKSNNNVIIGDAVETLPEAPDGRYGAILCDAYYGHDLPEKFFTKDFLKQYMRKLNSNGFLLLHVSNHDLDMKPIIAKIAAELGIDGYFQSYKIRRSPYNKDDKKKTMFNLLTKTKKKDDSLRSFLSEKFIEVPKQLLYWIFGNITQDHTDSSCDYIILSKNGKLLDYLFEDDPKWSMLNPVRMISEFDEDDL